MRAERVRRGMKPQDFDVLRTSTSVGKKDMVSLDRSCASQRLLVTCSL